MSSHKEYESFYSVVNKAVENGCRSFDTAPSYKTEPILGRAIRQCIVEHDLTRSDFFIQNKIDAWQMQDGKKDIENHVTQSLKCMDMDYFDSLLIHWPIPEFFNKTWEALQYLKLKGVVNRIGVCNVRLRHLKEFHSLDMAPDYIQIERHPLMVFEDEINFCKANNINVQAYSPLCKMHANLKDSSTLKLYSEKYGKSIGQVILRWHVDTGVIPVFTSRKPERVVEYLNIFDFKLNDEDIKSICGLNENYKLCLESFACPGF